MGSGEYFHDVFSAVGAELQLWTWTSEGRWAQFFMWCRFLSWLIQRMFFLCRHYFWDNIKMHNTPRSGQDIFCTCSWVFCFLGLLRFLPWVFENAGGGGFWRCNRTWKFPLNCMCRFFLFETNWLTGLCYFLLYHSDFLMKHWLVFMTQITLGAVYFQVICELV